MRKKKATPKRRAIAGKPAVVQFPSRSMERAQKVEELGDLVRVLSELVGLIDTKRAEMLETDEGRRPGGA